MVQILLQLPAQAGGTELLQVWLFLVSLKNTVFPVTPALLQDHLSDRGQGSSILNALFMTVSHLQPGTIETNETYLHPRHKKYCKQSTAICQEIAL